ncbi:hypothetical protein TNIN_498491 [Trichonephila inaurata madagascariensis]|uniref:Uncharacterized protein n=1 Tax=Trichonephila inaurata madagascariensis TaxID=2747483 RepID=A0A8X6YNB2_9ARAC|nr:hypothetical protein TNIN_498491 [Trichonephila inaurata madagascariensis]
MRTVRSAPLLGRIGLRDGADIIRLAWPPVERCSPLYPCTSDGLDMQLFLLPSLPAQNPIRVSGHDPTFPKTPSALSHSANNGETLENATILFPVSLSSNCSISYELLPQQTVV